MSLIAAVRTGASTDVLTSLRAVCDSYGLADLSRRLQDLAELVSWDMKQLEEALAMLPFGERDVHKGARHLLQQGGKRLRPMCVALAARVGGEFSEKARELAVAVELVHCATLLHDDVVDLGAERRGAPAARLVYGNAASIFAGDWLLVEALRRVRNTRFLDVLDALIAIIDEMICAESIQLERRGDTHTSAETYFQIIEGKTAALFRWAMYAGGRVGGLEQEQSRRLEGYGTNLGVAFQLIDDVLDYSGDSQRTGKAVLGDLREGKMTYPLILLLAKDPSFRSLLARLVDPRENSDATLREHSDDLHALLQALHDHNALDESRALAEHYAAKAIETLHIFGQSPAVAALTTVAQATVHRDV